MTLHPVYGFMFDKTKTSNAYQNLDLKFEYSDIKSFCYSFITEALFNHKLDLGINPEKPWEEIIMDNYYQVAYLFCGKKTDLFNQNVLNKIGINLFEEKNFGKNEFESQDILNLTFIIDRF
jgi:hypothetical protein